MLYEIAEQRGELIVYVSGRGSMGLYKYTQLFHHNQAERVY